MPQQSKDFLYCLMTQWNLRHHPLMSRLKLRKASESTLNSKRDYPMIRWRCWLSASDPKYRDWDFIYSDSMRIIMLRVNIGFIAARFTSLACNEISQKTHYICVWFIRNWIIKRKVSSQKICLLEKFHFHLEVENFSAALVSRASDVSINSSIRITSMSFSLRLHTHKKPLLSHKSQFIHANPQWTQFDRTLHYDSGSIMFLFCDHKVPEKDWAIGR